MGFISMLCGLRRKKPIHDQSRNVPNTPPQRQTTSNVSEVQSDKQHVAKLVLLPRHSSQAEEKQHASAPEPLSPVQKAAQPTALIKTPVSVQGSLTPAQRSSLNESLIREPLIREPLIREPLIREPLIREPSISVSSQVPAQLLVSAANPAQVELPDIAQSLASIQSHQSVQVQRPPTPPRTQAVEQSLPSSQASSSIPTSVLTQDSIVVQPLASVHGPQVTTQSQFSFQWPPLAAQVPQAAAKPIVPSQWTSDPVQQPPIAPKPAFSFQGSPVPAQESSVLVQPLLPSSGFSTSTQPLFSFNTFPALLQGSPSTVLSPISFGSQPKEPQAVAQPSISFGSPSTSIEGPPTALQPSPLFQWSPSQVQVPSSSGQWPAVSAFPAQATVPVQPSFPVQSSIPTKPSIPSVDTPPTAQTRLKWYRDWEDWIYSESVTLPERQEEFNERKTYPFVQITRTNACNFYDIESAEMDATLPQRKFIYGGCLASAFEHRAVRRLVYMRIAYVKGWHERISVEEELYQKGRELFNQYHDERVEEYKLRGKSFAPISIYYRNNNDHDDHRYRPIETGFDSRKHDKYG